MRLAKDRDVDMVLLAGDLFHDNKPSRKSMYEVMRSLRVNCFGDKPCELQMLSDASEVFQGAFNHANYEDEDLNVAIPVFSIHGNHDDPSGEGHYAALDLLQISGLLNYYGRVPESDNIDVKPVLLQKGKTKLALYGLSNVRDERLFRTFRDGKVKFYQPRTQKDDWFNLLSVHQNHHAYTDTGYLPENFLPGFMDLVIWGHEHECLIDPTMNPEMGFHVMQPGSSVATSLSPGEAVPKHVAILSITGKEFTCESIRLKSVRPFVMREIVLSDDKNMKTIAKKSDNRTQITRYLQDIVNEMIEEARHAWAELQDEVPEDPEEWPRPLIRLRVEYSAPDGGKYDCENPQRFSNRFHGRVANVSDVVQFHRKKRSGGSRATAAAKPEMPDEEAIAALSIDNVKVDELVKEFLTAQSLTILPQNSFGDAVGQFVEKDDNHAVKMFVNESLDSQVKHLLMANEMDEDGMVNAMEEYKEKLEQLFGQGHLKAKRKAAGPRPLNWDSDLDGDWDGQVAQRVANGGSVDLEEDEEEDQPRPRARNTKVATAPKSNTRKPAAAKKAPAKKTTNSRSKKKAISDEEDDEDVIMIDDEEEDDLLLDDEEEESQGLFVSERLGRAAAPAPKKRAPPAKKAPPKPASKSAARATTSAKQGTLNFSQPTRPAKATAARKVHEVVSMSDRRRE